MSGALRSGTARALYLRMAYYDPYAETYIRRRSFFPLLVQGQAADEELKVQRGVSVAKLLRPLLMAVVLCGSATATFALCTVIAAG